MPGSPNGTADEFPWPSSGGFHCETCTCPGDEHIVTKSREEKRRHEELQALKARAAEIKREAEGQREARRQAAEALAQSIRQGTEGDQ